MSSLRSLALVMATAAATTGVVLPIATAQQQQAAAPAPAPQLVAGLPDFTRLVDEVGDAVVNIEAQVGGRRSAARGQPLPDDPQLPEFFRRFFGPGSPFPNMPDDPYHGGGRRGTAMGSGFLISADGYVLTNHHVVDGADTVKVKLPDRREFNAKVVGSDEQSDVAVLKIDASGLPSLRLGNSDALKPGQWVVAIGSPFGLDHSVTAGIVSAVGRSNPYSGQQYVPFIQTDVAISRGNSGGPLLNTRGEVVGINSQIFSNSGGYMGVSFAIPIDTAMNAVDQLKRTGRVSRGLLGVNLQPITADAASSLDLPDTRGALVNNVQPGGAGAKAGLQPGDVIRGVDGRSINDFNELPPIIGAKAPGTRVQLDVLRNGRTQKVTAVLGELEPQTNVANTSANPIPGSTAAPRAAATVLGFVPQELDAATRRQLDLGAGEGVGIGQVRGAAREAGLQSGDVVLQVGSAKVGSVAALERELRNAGANRTVMLLVRRGQSTQFVAVNPTDAGTD